MPIKYNQERFGPTEKEFKNRNNTVRKVFNAKGLPRNMGDKEILSRVKVYDNVRTLKGMRNSRYGNDLKMKISNFISNGRVFNQRKRKALVELMLRFGGPHPHILEILALKNEDVIRYIKYTADFFGDSGVEYRGGRIPHYIANLTYKRPGPHPDYYKRRRGPIREDPGAVRVLKKRAAFLKEMLKVQQPRIPGYGGSGGVMRIRLPRNIRNKISVSSREDANYIHPRHIWRFMQKEFPLPPHPINAATKIQSAARGMRNRKKLTTMRKAATTIQKRARAVSAKRKASTSIKTTSVKRRKTNR
jgi:hypothetical protein